MSDIIPRKMRAEVALTVKAEREAWEALVGATETGLVSDEQITATITEKATASAAYMVRLSVSDEMVS